MRQVMILLVVAAIGVTAYLFRSDLPPLVQGWLGAAQSPASAPSPQAPPTVTVAQPLVQELVEWDEFSGRFRAVEQVEIRARVGGFLESVGFVDGARAEADDVLFVIDQRPFKLAVDRSRAAVSSAEADVTFARQELERAQDLVRRNAVPQSVVDERERQFATTEADLAAMRVAQQQAELELEFTTVRAPFAGQLSDRRIDVGNLVNSDTVLTTLVRTDPIQFEFDVTEDVLLAYRRAVRKGELPSLETEDGGAAVRLVDEPDWNYPARIDFVDNVVNQGSGTVRVRAVVANEDGLVLPGQFGYVRIPGSPRYPAMLVPDEAIVSDQANRILLTVDDSGTVVPRIVRPGPREYGLRIIRSGLEPTDRIIVNGLSRARPGQKVTPEAGEIALWPNGGPS